MWRLSNMKEEASERTVSVTVFLQRLQRLVQAKVYWHSWKYRQLKITAWALNKLSFIVNAHKHNLLNWFCNNGHETRSCEAHKLQSAHLRVPHRLNICCSDSGRSSFGSVPKRWDQANVGTCTIPPTAPVPNQLPVWSLKDHELYNNYGVTVLLFFS